MAEQTLAGRNYSTPDLVAKVTGRARYAEDYRAEGMLFCKLLLSPMPHAAFAAPMPPPLSRCPDSKGFSPPMICRSRPRLSAQLGHRAAETQRVHTFT
jgi:hypothetical protein